MTTVSTSVLGAMVTPALLYAGVGAASIPILIHLLSRRRFRRVRWAAIDFLLEANRRNRRRVRIEELILLGLRCLAMLLIGLMLARVFLRPEALAAVLGAPAPTERIIVLDDSFSMGLRDRSAAGGATVFTRATTAVERLVRWLREESPHDPLTIVLTSQPDRSLAGEVNVGQTDVAALAEELESLKPSNRGGNMPAAMAAVRRLLEARSASVNAAVYVVSDFQRRDWVGDRAEEGERGRGGGGATRAPDESARGGKQSPLAALAEWTGERHDLRVVLVDVGVSETSNTCITAIAPRQPQVVAGVPAGFVARIANFGETASKESSMQVYMGGAAQPAAAVPVVGPGQSAEVPFEITFGQHGSQGITVELQADALPIDDARAHVVSVARALRVLLVDGEPSTDPYEDEVFLLSVALRPEGPQFSGNEIVVVDENEFADTDLSGFHVVVLANVFRVSEDAAARLTDYVASGGGLAVFLGDQVDAELYNRTLYRDGRGLLPAGVGDVVMVPADRVGVAIGQPDGTHPVMQRFADAEVAYFAGVTVQQYVTCRFATSTSTAPAEPSASAPANGAGAETHEAGPARVLLRLADPDHSPLMVERGCGQGRVWLITSSADKEWNNLADHSIFVVLATEMVQYLARRDQGGGDRLVGEPIRFTLEPGRYEPAVVVKPPSYPDEPAVRIDAQPDPDRGLPTVLWQRTEQPGVYTFELTETSGQASIQHASVNVDPTESDLRPADRASLAQEVPGLAVEYVRGDRLVGSAHSEARQQLWPALLLALVVVLMSEQALARWFGTK